MKQLILLVFSIVIYSAVHAQRHDSLPITGGFLHYHIYGKGKPVVILTGGPGISSGQQEDVALRVSKDCQAILVEQRGTGRSMPATLDKEHINIDTAAADVKSILDRLAIKEAVIYGHSYGSLLAMYFGSKYPEKVRSLILVGPAPFNYLGDQMPTYGDNKEARIGFSDLETLNTLDLKASKGQLTKEDTATFRKISNSSNVYDKARIDSIMLFVAKGKMNSKTMQLLSSSYNGKLDLTSQLKKFCKPIDIICGRQDALAFMAYEYKLANASVKIHWIKQAGHFPMFEQEKAFYETLSSTLKL